MKNKTLWALAFGGFAIGMTEFVIMGILKDVALSLDISIPRAGNAISMYALGVVVGAPLISAFTSHLPPKKVSLVLMGIFTIFNGLTSLSDQFLTLTISRFFSGLPHGAFFGIGSIIATKVTPPQKHGSAIAFMFSGLTMANMLGVPLGTYIGHEYGWQKSFYLVTAWGALTTVSLFFWVPDIEARGKVKVLDDLKTLKSFNLLLMILIMSIGTGGFFAWLSYISPLLNNYAGLRIEYIPYVMILVGVGMTAGNIIGGKLAEALPPNKAMLYILIANFILLILCATFAKYAWAAITLSFFIGAAAMAMISPGQVLLLSLSRGAEQLGASLGQSSANIGNALGAFVGGIPLALGYGENSAVYMGAILCFLGILFTAKLLSRNIKGELPQTA